MTDNRQTPEAATVREKSEFIKRIEDFARYMTPEYINGSDNPRSLVIIAADCLDAKSGEHAMAHIMVGDNRVGRCALRSMMESNDTFAAQVHELCDDDGSRSVEDLDGEIGRKRKQLTCSMWEAVGIAAWSATVILLLVAGLINWVTMVTTLLVMAWGAMLVGLDIKKLRLDIARLCQQRKRAVGRQRIMSRISEFGEFLRRMRSQLEEDAGEDDDDD